MEALLVVNIGEFVDIDTFLRWRFFRSLDLTILVGSFISFGIQAYVGFLFVQVTCYFLVGNFDIWILLYHCAITNGVGRGFQINREGGGSSTLCILRVSGTPFSSSYWEPSNAIHISYCKTLICNNVFVENVIVK